MNNVAYPGYAVLVKRFYGKVIFNTFLKRPYLKYRWFIGKQLIRLVQLVLRYSPKNIITNCYRNFFPTSKCVPRINISLDGKLSGRLRLRTVSISKNPDIANGKLW